MNTALLNRLLQEKGWQFTWKCQGHYVFSNVSRPQAVQFITPAIGSEPIPAGTLNVVLRLAHSKEKAENWPSFIRQAKKISVVLEKQTDGGIWGRIDIPGLMIVTRGCTADCVTDSLRTLLIEFAVEEAPSCCSALISLPFVSVYDTTAVWSLVKQLKTTHIADQVGIDMELIGQFMTGNTHPCSEVATRIERSIHELGRQLMRVSIQ